ncbi:imidazole glycerol phosphate synthase subunit HisH [Akkermansiaceae bacterium]|nr:imidazole glycerol phosphate synthase subunit HisH [Akkermansiaceae bacterium]
MITIIDYGMGNLGSIQNMFEKKIKVNCEITSDLDKIKSAEKLLLPGVGAFDKAIQRISKDGLRDVLDMKVLHERTPILGICLGMQLLTNGSDEGKLPGLGWIDAYTHRFSFEKADKIKVPHMGWNEVHLSQASLLTTGLSDLVTSPDKPRFYFVHSYYVKVKNQSNSILRTNYGHEFDSAIQKDNIYGTQFHPEKSHKFGVQLFKNFAEL